MQRIESPYRFSAFTLTEVMVTMVVSSLVILLSYTALQMLNHYFHRTGQHNELYSERLGFRSVMTSDLDVCDSIVSSGEQLIFYVQGQEQSWSVIGGGLSRKTVSSDLAVSFKSGTIDWKAFSSHESHLVNRILIRLWDGDKDSLQFNLYKHYGLDVGVNHNSKEVMNP